MPNSAVCNHLVYLTNYFPPHSVPLFKSLSTHVNKLTILISSAAEPNRLWTRSEEGLNVVRQRNLMLRKFSRHPQGFSDEQYIHIPYDTLPQLFSRRPDVVLSLELGMRTMQALIYRLLNPSSRLIVWAAVSERTEQGRGKAREILRKLILNYADAVLVNGASGFRYIQKFGVPDRKIFLVPYTTDVERFHSIPLTRSPEESLRLLFVGQMINRKGLVPFLDVLTHWMRLHTDRKVEFLLVGDGPIRIQLMGTSRPDNLVLSWGGNHDYSEIPIFYAKAGIFVFPSLADEWGLVVNEAMMSGLPVLGSIYSQAVEEMVEEGKNGWLFSPDDPQSILHALEIAMNTSSNDLEKMRLSARKTAERFGPDDIAQKIVSAINLSR